MYHNAMAEIATSSLASGSMPSPVSKARSYTFTKYSGYTIVLQHNGSAWLALVHDNRFPGLKRSYLADVRFENGYILENFITKHSSWQSRRIHIIDKGVPLVYFGSLGLKGGLWVASLFEESSCKWFCCSGTAWRCVCGFRRNNVCHYHSYDKVHHICIKCRRENRCPKFYNCKTCYSTITCYDCCGCRERQLRESQQKERERKERERKERERKEKERKEKERKEQQRRQQERKRKEQLKQRQEKERKERLRKEQERKQQQEREQRQAVLSKLDDCLSSAQIDQEDTSVQITSTTSITNESTTDQVNQEQSYEFVNNDGNIQEDCEALLDPIATTTDLTDDHSDYNSDKQTPVTRNNNGGLIGNLKSLHTFLLHPISAFSKQSLLKEISSYANEDDPSLKYFKNKWSKIEDEYAISDQEILLKSLKDRKGVHNLSLLDITKILDLILQMGEPAFNIVCKEQDKWLSDSKLVWLEPKLLGLTKVSVHERSALGAFLSEMDWCKDMMEQFLKSIENTTTLDPIISFLYMVRKKDIPDFVALSTITNNPLDSNEIVVVQQWIHTIIYHSFLQKISQLSRDVAQCAGPSLAKLLRFGCSDEFLENVITDNIDLINGHKNKFVEVLNLLCDYQVREEICTSAFSVLSQVSADNWVEEIDQVISSKLFEDAQVYTLDELIEEIIDDETNITAEELSDLYDNVLQSYNSISQILQSVNDSDTNNFKNRPFCDWNKECLTIWANHVKSSSSISQSELIAGVRHAVKLHHGFFPRDTQMLSLLILLNPSPGMGRLAQINTGEGKSLIVAMLATIHALQGKKVDVITTSTELSIPEVEKQRPFFASLSVTVAENSKIDTKESAYQSDVLYGTSGDFQADILRTEFLGQDIRGDRGFNIVVVDEVDSMLFDYRSHSVRLSDATPGMIHLELSLAVIWQHINQIVAHFTTVGDQVYFIVEDFERNGNEIKLYSGKNWQSCAMIVDDKRKFIIEQTQSHLEQLLRELSPEERDEYRAYKSLNNQIADLEEEISKISCDEEKESKTAHCKSLSEKLKTLPWKERYPVLDVPNHLRSIAVSRIPNWTRSALNAAYGYKKGAHYAVQNGRIVPIQYNETGVLQPNMVWSDGLTQFLQLKEGLRMDPEGVSTNFISNVSFFQRYGSAIYGLTGTLGETSTINFLHKVYHTDTIIIPPYQRRPIIDNEHSPYLCKELIPIVLSNETEWTQTVIDRALSHAQHKRAVLIICKFINQVKHFAENLRKKYDDEKIFTYTGEEENFEKSKIDSGEIIIATNIAGRGTDLKTSESVESHGGMYVAVTFLPKSFRVEMQNVGRTGRSGKKGMGQLIIYNPAKSNIKDIKKDRDAHESAANEKAIQDAEKMLLQDRLFKEFCTLERRYLPGVSMISMRQKWVNLTESYEQYKASEFSPDKITKYVDDMVLKRKKTLVNEVQCKIDSLTDEEKSKLMEDDKQNYYKKAANQAESERSIFKEQHKKLVLDHFFRSQSHQPEELLSCLKDGREFESKFSTFALRYQWGLSDRRGFEECWGLWLKSQNFDENRTSMDEALNRFHNSFGTPSKERAEKDELVQNPYYYVLKGNRYLTSGRDTLDQAISCYDRAIAMDPDFSVNARYNKAMTLLSFEENEGPRQRLAYAELKRAKEIIVTIAKPALLSLNVLIGENRERIHTSEHIQHQLNLLSQQENYINKACKVIEEAQSKEYHVKLTANPIIDTFEPDEQHKYNKAIDEATVNGFTHLFTIAVVKPFPWASIIGLALLSLAQMVAGCLLVACTAGAVGTGLIAEGVSDMITVVKSAIEGSFDWAAWAIEKAVGLAISIISCGIKTLSKGLTAVKDGIKAVTNTAKTVINKVTTGEITKQGIKLAAKELGKALAKGVIKEVVTEATKCIVDKVILEKIEKLIEDHVEKAITKALSNNPLVVKLLELDAKNGNQVWKSRLLAEGLSLLKEREQNECIETLKKISMGVIENYNSKAATAIQAAQRTTIIIQLTGYTNHFIREFNKKIQSLETESKKDDSQENATEHSKPSTSAKSNEEHVSNAPDIDLKETDIPNDSVSKGTSYSSKSKPKSKDSKTPDVKDEPHNLRDCAETQLKIISNKFKNKMTQNISKILRDEVVSPTIENVTEKLSLDMDSVKKNMLAGVQAIGEVQATVGGFISEHSVLGHFTAQTPQKKKYL
ncbi:uncharacterized protein LOC129804644 [Phlebotomus papatasi]|uniref:uncharacterized protein LOC129804644 n=1 Tax=Phlebotomus papatasi TaxID=29031 RepID=UPI00248472D3|nr:uncharacterized protein LOC129804644 [Phlebotomus papatasi]